MARRPNKTMKGLMPGDPCPAILAEHKHTHTRTHNFEGAHSLPPVHGTQSHLHPHAHSCPHMELTHTPARLHAGEVTAGARRCGQPRWECEHTRCEGGRGGPTSR